MAKIEKVFLAENGVAVGENVAGSGSIVIGADGNLTTQTITGRVSATDITISTGGTGKVSVPSSVKTPTIGPDDDSLHVLPDVAADTIALLNAAQTLTNKTFGIGNSYESDIPVRLASGGTGSNLVDPNDDRILFWDDSAGATTWLDQGPSIVITGTSVDTVQDIRTTANPVFNTAVIGSSNQATYSNLGISISNAGTRTFQYGTDDWNSSENIDLAAGKVYQINDVDVLSSTTLGSGVVNSSLTSVGQIATGEWKSNTPVGLQYGGTGATNQDAAAKNVLPAIAAQNGKFLYTDGTNIVWTPASSAPQVGYTVKTNRSVTAGNGTAVYTTPYYINGSGQLRVYLDGVRQNRDNTSTPFSSNSIYSYNEAGTTGQSVNSITFSENIPATSSILFEVDYYEQYDFPAENVAVYTPITGMNSTISTTARSRTSNVATLTVASTVGLTVGDYVSISGFTDGTFNTTVAVKITQLTGTGVSYANSGPDVLTVLEPGTINVIPSVSSALKKINDRTGAGGLTGILHGNATGNFSVVNGPQFRSAAGTHSSKNNWATEVADGQAANSIIVHGLGYASLGNGGYIFDGGSATRSDVNSPWRPGRAVLMAWSPAQNGTQGVRVDSAKYAEKVSEQALPTATVYDIGYRGIPTSSNTTISTSDRGKCLEVSTNVTIPNGVMSEGDVVSIFNTGSTTITILSNLTLLYLAGTNLGGNRTLLPKGLAAIRFISSTSAVISGAGLV